MQTDKQTLNKFGSDVIRLAKINLGASQTIDGKKRVTKNTGALSKSLGYQIDQNRTKDGKFMSGFNIKFTSSLSYASFIEQGVKGSESTKPSAKRSPFKFKSKNLPKGVMMKWIKSKPIKPRDKTGKFSKNTKSSMNSLAFVLGRAVATKGISARNYLRDAIEQSAEKQGAKMIASLTENYINNLFKDI